MEAELGHSLTVGQQERFIHSFIPPSPEEGYNDFYQIQEVGPSALEQRSPHGVGKVDHGPADRVGYRD